MKGLLRQQKGFTLLELLVVIGIIGALFGMITINLLRAQRSASVSAATDELISDMHTQQTKAMTGANDTTGNPNSYGIAILANSYKLFQGTTDPGDSTDFTVNQDGIIFSTNLPNNQLVFDHGSGMFHGYVDGTNYTITVQNANGTEQKVLTINRYGIVASIQSQ